MDWRPLSQRIAGGDDGGPYTGIPDHLTGPLMDWLEAALQTQNGWLEPQMQSIVLRMRIPVPSGATGRHIWGAMQKAALADDDVFLDLVDAALFLRSAGNWRGHERLSGMLALAGSVWTVNSEATGLVEVVGPEMRATYDGATAVEDETTAQLREAWTKAYGRSPDTSDAWDHAIKAVESVLVPVVQPNNSKATLSNVLGELAGQQAGLWEMVLPGNDKSHDVAPLVAMLRLLWPNHDRHGGGTTREASIEEAQAVTTLSAAIVQWHRQGWVIRRR